MIRRVDDIVTVRQAQPGDASEMARLAGELGYPLAPDEMRRRLERILPDSHHYIAVASSGQRIMGWMHVERRISLEGGERAELMGLIVEPTVRRRGIGRRLVDMAENWVLAKGLAQLTVRSNTARVLSHPFYEALGYQRAKTQHVYVKRVTLNTG
jgi:GNAT superfamily N-acetyltransferase